MSITSAFSLPIAGFQIGAGIQAKRRADAVSDAVMKAAQADAQLTRLQGVLRRGQAQANLGGVSLAGSPTEALAQDAFMTEKVVSRILLGAALRQERIKAEGEADLLAGVAGGITSLATGIQTALDLPSERNPFSILHERFGTVEEDVQPPAFQELPFDVPDFPILGPQQGPGF